MGAANGAIGRVLQEGYGEAGVLVKHGSKVEEVGLRVQLQRNTQGLAGYGSVAEALRAGGSNTASRVTQVEAWWRERQP